MNIDEKVETKININRSEPKNMISTEAEKKYNASSDRFSDSDGDIAFSDRFLSPTTSSDSDSTTRTFWSKDLKKDSKTGSKTKRKSNKCTSKLEKRYKCESCDMRFTHNNKLKLHARTHTGEKPFKCSECNKSYYRKQHLVTHSRSHALNQPMNTYSDLGRKFKCEFCNKKFYTTYHLKRHKATHKGENPYECSRCYLKCLNKEDLDLHFVIHEPNHQEMEPIEVLRKEFFDLNRRYKCEYCKKRFKRPQHLEGHIRIHTGEKPYECLWCYKKFSRKDSLVIHSEIHEINSAPDLKEIIRESINQIFNEIALNTDCHICDWEGCERRFLDYSDFIFHSSIHMKEYRFQCSFGSNNIKQPIPLMYHIETSHPINNRAYQYEVTTIRKNKIIVAEDGSLRLSHNSDTNNNTNDDTVSVEKKNNDDQILRNIADINWNCYCFVRRLSSTEMGKGFIEKEILECHQCKALFKTELEGIKHYLCLHRKNMPMPVLKKKFKCSVCDKKYLRKRQLTQHRRTHTETHPLLCSLCNKNFSRSDSLYRHLKIHERSNLQARKCLVMNQSIQKELKSKRTKEKLHNWSDDSSDNSLSVTSYLGVKKERRTERSVTVPRKRGRPRLKPLKPLKLISNEPRKRGRPRLDPTKFGTKYKKKLAGLMTDLEQSKNIEDEKHNAFVCHWQGCNNRFFDYYDLITHSEIHLNNQSFQCSMCPEIFQQVSHLNIHCETQHSLKTSDIGSGRSTVENKKPNMEMIDLGPTIKIEKEEPDVIVMQSATGAYNICSNKAICKEELVLFN